MDAFVTHLFSLPLPEGHPFPIRKYQRLHERALELVPQGLRLLVPPTISPADLSLVHDPEYIDRVMQGTLAPEAQRRIGFPWSPEMVERSRRSCGATLAACRSALRDGIAVSLAGGTHHAHRDWGQGYCVFNDTVVAARVLQREGLIRRVLILDCDVHQGNGTANLTAGDPTIWTFSIHMAQGFPLRRSPSDLDLGLPDGTGDESYLETLDLGLAEVESHEQPDLAIYLAGADPYREDRNGRLDLSMDGLARRDWRVLTFLRERRIPVALTMAGGYAPNIDDIASIHSTTIHLALEHYRLEHCAILHGTSAPIADP